MVCVESSSALATALSSLSTSSVNDDSDEIRIRTGTYHAPTGGWTGAVTTRHDLVIRGGYSDAGCTQQTLDAAATILDGNNASGVLTIDTPLIPDSDIEVSGLTFQNGHGGNAFESNAGGLKIGDPNPINGGRIPRRAQYLSRQRGDRQWFQPGRRRTPGGYRRRSLVVRGNLFVNNSSPNAPALSVYSNNAIDVANNTFTGNHATDAAQARRVTLDYITFARRAVEQQHFLGQCRRGRVVRSRPGRVVARNRRRDADQQRCRGVDRHGRRRDGNAAYRSGIRRRRQLPSVARLAAHRRRASAIPSGGLTSVDLDGGARIAGAAVDLGAYESAAASAGPPIGGGFSGNWFDPTPNQGRPRIPDRSAAEQRHARHLVRFQSGRHGAELDLHCRAVTMPGATRLPCRHSSNRADAFPPNFDSRNVTPTPWGSLTLTFADCDNGTAVWAPNAQAAAAGYAAVTFPVRRLTSLAGTTCP